MTINNEWVNGVLSQVQNILANYTDSVHVGSSTRATLTDIRSEILRRVHLLNLEVRFLDVLFAEYDKAQANLDKDLPPLEDEDFPIASSPPKSDKDLPLVEDESSGAGDDAVTAGDVDMAEA